jgi:hypothetical protein
VSDQDCTVLFILSKRLAELFYFVVLVERLVTRWAKTLFQQTLPELVRSNMLTYPSARGRKRGRDRKKFEEGVVYLPFCAHVCKELVGGIHLLEKHYAITFVKKSELAGHALWKGTMSIDGDTMQHVLGKRLDQEEVYCTFRPKDIYENMEDSHVSKPSVMRILQAIEDYDNIRMIRLRPLRQHEPPSVLKKRLIEPEKGGFIGLNFNLAREKRQHAELEAKGKKLAAKKERERIRKEEEKGKLTIQKQTEAQRKKKFRERREKKVRKVAQQKAPKLKQREQPVYEDVEEITVEESKYKYFYPGPAADIETYEEPEANQGTIVYDSISGGRKKRPSVASARTSVVRTPHHFLAFNPRVATRKHKRAANRKGSGKKGPGSAVLDVYIPPGEYEVEGACNLMGLRDRGFQDISCNLYGRNELSKLFNSITCIFFMPCNSHLSIPACFKVPAEDVPGPSELSTEEKIKVDRWKVKLTRSIFGAQEGNQRNFILLGRYKNMEDILNWLRNHMHPMFDPSRKFEELHLELEWFGNEGIFEIAEEMEEALHEHMIFGLEKISTTNEEWGELYANIFDWLRNGRVENDPTGEFIFMKRRLQNSSFESDEELANEMTCRIIVLRKFCGDWSCLGKPMAPQGSVFTFPQNDMLELQRDETPLPAATPASRPTTRGRRRKTGESSKGRNGKPSPKKKAVAAKARRPTETGALKRKAAANVEISIPSKSDTSFQTPSRGGTGRNVNVSPIIACSSRRTRGTPATPGQHSLHTQMPTSPIQQNDARDLLRIFNTTEEGAQRFYTEAASKIGPQRARMLCRILRFLEDPNPSGDKTGEFRWIAKLMPPRMPLVRKGYIMEAVLNSLREGHGENWYGLSYIPGGLGVLLSEVLQDIEALVRIPDEAFRLKLLMGGLMHNSGNPQCVSPSPPTSIVDGFGYYQYQPVRLPPLSPIATPPIAAPDRCYPAASRGLYEF